MKLTATAAVVATLFTAAASGPAAQAPAARSTGADRFEVTSIKAVRPALASTLEALKKGDVARAREAFEAYDSGWNGIEVYINTRDRRAYNELEKTYQSRIEEGLNGPMPNVAALVTDVQLMLARFDGAIVMVEKGAPLSPLYDDIARVRIARAPLRAVNPAVKEGHIAKARTSMAALRRNWTGVKDLIKVRSNDAYEAIEKGMTDIDRALKAGRPNPDEVAPLVNGVMGKFNAVAFDLTTAAKNGGK